jgi:hypothetical protein
LREGEREGERDRESGERDDRAAHVGPVQAARVQLEGMEGVFEIERGREGRERGERVGESGRGRERERGAPRPRFTTPPSCQMKTMKNTREYERKVLLNITKTVPLPRKG